MTPRPLAVCAGYMPLDVICTGATTTERQAGGTAGNVAAILAFLGWRAVLAGQAGDDAAGKELVADLAAAGVDCGEIRITPGMLTPRLIHDVRPDGHFFRHKCPGCKSRFPRSRPLTLDDAAACVQTHPSPTAFFFDRANAGTLFLAEHYARVGSVIVFEPSVPANAELLARAAAVAHVIKHSDDRSVGGLDDLKVKPRPGQLRIITHGAEGLELRVGARRGRRFPALATLAVDTGGAGDWTTAGFLAKAGRRGQLDRDGVDDALRFGQALAAVSCAAIGSRGLMCITRDSVMRRARAVLADGGLTTELRIPDPQSLARLDGACSSCLMPLDNAQHQLAASSDGLALSAR